jgi:hypothetical protein
MSPAQRRVLTALGAGAAAGVLLLQMQSRRASMTSAPAGARARPLAESAIHFTDVTRESGIDFKHENGMTGRYRYAEGMGSGVALLDYDGDGDLDIYLVNGNRLEGAPDPRITSHLYRNDGHMHFTDVTEAAGVGVVGYSQGVCVGDADGDGKPDLYVTMLGGSRFFRNRGDGTFEDHTKAAHLEQNGWGQSCTFLDYDGDGRLDLYLARYLTYTVDMPQEQDVVRDGHKVRDYIGPWAFAGQASLLYRNRGDGTFEDTTRAAGVFQPDGKGMGVVAADFDGDNRTDIFQANDGVPNFLFQNLGHGRFQEVGLTAGVAVPEDGIPKASMGIDAADFDGDGDLDLTIPVVHHFTQLRNDGALFFTDVSVVSGVAEATGRLTGFSANAADFDDDGDLDLFFANGEVQSHELISATADYETRYGTPAAVLANNGDGTFVPVSESAGPYFARALIGRGSAIGDLDDDGKIDLVVSNLAGHAVVLHNDSRGGHWLTLALRDHGGNIEAIGAKVWLSAGGRTQYREVSGGGAYLSANDRRLHFGLGAAPRADKIEIRWPDGTRETKTDVAADRVLIVEHAR